jgi:peroxiredoxin
MKIQFFKFIIVSILFILCSFNLIVKDKQVSDFKLKNAKTNKLVSLSDYKNVKGFIIIFTCNKCPMAKFYSQRLNQMNEKYTKMGVPLIAINSMDTLAYAEESFKRMQNKVKNDHLNFPYLQDKKQAVGKNFKASVTPQAFVIWKQNNKFVVKYEGSIDDNAGDYQNVKNHFLTNAVDQLLKENEVTIEV